MITKKVIPVGMVELKDGKKFMNVLELVVEYRIFGILLYKKTIISPRDFGADYYEYETFGGKI